MCQLRLCKNSGKARILVNNIAATLKNTIFDCKTQKGQNTTTKFHFKTLQDLLLYYLRALTNPKDSSEVSNQAEVAEASFDACQS